jgi:hypothetical protein
MEAPLKKLKRIIKSSVREKTKGCSTKGERTGSQIFAGDSLVTSLVQMTHVNKAPHRIRRGAGFQSLQLAYCIDVRISDAFFSPLLLPYSHVRREKGLYRRNQIS